ncbi:MAG TPA: SDR family oxidoreductase [Anaerolineales bacterium]|nr:SDR family oxidoreductase [Anaerolineales bacterium]HNN12917.1 SDR family oxidoreductase [Anaerolineales bacterium]HNO32436.1 SDR family oxidoreductase [Anaerolineales bacterium]
MDLNLNSRIALVTGASKGLGYATALQLAREGCKVAINGRDEARVNGAAEKFRNETGAEVVALAGDVGLPDMPAKLVQQTVDAFGGLDILITNTGGPTPGNIDSLDEAAWQKGIDLCLMAHVRLVQAALPHLRKSQSASILTVTSVSVKQPIQNLLISNSVRAAAVGLTKSLAIDLGREGIRVNSILPGWTETERVTELMTARATKNQSTVEEEMRRQAVETPLGRMGQPEEFARAAVFLVSPAASYITGVMLQVDGGSYKGTL